MNDQTNTAKKSYLTKFPIPGFGCTYQIIIIIIVFAIGIVIGGKRHSDPIHDHDSENGSQAELDDIEGDIIWTCSMHPQIRAEEFGLCPLCNMDLIPVSDDDDADAAARPRLISISESARQLLNIQTTPVERRFVETDIRMVGKVAIDETRLATISAWVPGRIDRLYVDFTGIQVREGDHMVALYSPDLLSAQEELRAAARTFESLRSGAPDSLRRTAESTLDAVRARLYRWGLTEDQVRQAESGEWQSDQVTIYAPIGGTVIQREGTEGMYVDVGTPIYTIADLRQVWVMLEAYESDLPWIHYGQPVSFTASALPGETFEGIISFIDPVLNPDTRTVRVRVNVANTDGRLKPDMFVQGYIRSQVATGGRVVQPELAGKWISPMHPEVIKDAPGNCTVCGMPLVRAETLGYVTATVTDADKPLVIPRTAPLITGKRALVYVSIPDTERPTFEGREIVLGPRAGDYYLVVSGLEAGERVVTHGTFKIDSALQVLARPSMMAPDALFEKWDDTPLDGIEFALREEMELVLEAALLLAGLDIEADSELNDAAENMMQHFDDIDASVLPPEAQGYWSEFVMKQRNNSMGLLAARSIAERKEFQADIRRLADKMGAIFGLVDAPLPDAPETLQADIRKVFEAYIAIQQALADDDYSTAQNAIPALDSLLRAIDLSEISDSDVAQWESWNETMHSAIGEMDAAADLVAMRVPFEPLSDTLIEVIRNYGIGPGAPVFLVHCPMAFDFEGADWLQDHDRVLNPYFGDEMLMCGTVNDRLYAGDETTSVDDTEEAHDHG